MRKEYKHATIGWPDGMSRPHLARAVARKCEFIADNELAEQAKKYTDEIDRLLYILGINLR